MKCAISIDSGIESRFLLLPGEEKAAMISHGVAIRFSELNKRPFPAQSKIRFFEEKYGDKTVRLPCEDG